jgi:hypothetical protein
MKVKSKAPVYEDRIGNWKNWRKRACFVRAGKTEGTSALAVSGMPGEWVAWYAS